MLVSQAIGTEPDDVDQPDTDALTRGGHTHELTLVSSRRTNARDDFVTAYKDVLRLHPQIGKRCRVHAEELLDPVLRRHEPRSLLVLDEIVGEEIAKPIDIPCTDQLIDALHRRRMIHRSPPFEVRGADCIARASPSKPRGGVRAFSQQPRHSAEPGCLRLASTSGVTRARAG